MCAREGHRCTFPSPAKRDIAFLWHMQARRRPVNLPQIPVRLNAFDRTITQGRFPLMREVNLYIILSEDRVVRAVGALAPRLQSSGLLRVAFSVDHTVLAIRLRTCAICTHRMLRVSHQLVI